MRNPAPTTIFFCKGILQCPLTLSFPFFHCPLSNPQDRSLTLKSFSLTSTFEPNLGTPVHKINKNWTTNAGKKALTFCQPI